MTNTEIISKGDKSYQKSLDSFLKIDNIIKFSPYVKVQTLKRFISFYKIRDPLDDTNLAKELVIKIDEKNVVSRLYEYAMAAAILSFNDKKLRSELKQYAIVNKFDADSKQHKLEKKLVGGGL